MSWSGWQYSAEEHNFLLHNKFEFARSYDKEVSLIFATLMLTILIQSQIQMSYISYSRYLLYMRPLISYHTVSSQIHPLPQPTTDNHATRLGYQVLLYMQLCSHYVLEFDTYKI